MENKVYSVILNEYKSQSGDWEKAYNFMTEDFSEVDFEKDWRVNAVPGRRKQAIFLGLLTNPSFPIQFPIYLDNGKVLDKI